jgi:hypothetical protein
MPAYLNTRRVRTERGKFAALFTTCRGCGGDLWDVLGKGTHPDDECERLAARKERKGRAA